MSRTTIAGPIEYAAQHAVNASEPDAQFKVEWQQIESKLIVARWNFPLTKANIEAVEKALADAHYKIIAKADYFESVGALNSRHGIAWKIAQIGYAPEVERNSKRVKQGALL